MYFGVIPRPLRSDDVDPEPGQPVQRALIAVLLDDNGITAGQQRRVDEIERLQRAGDDQDVVGGAPDCGIALEFGGEEFAQRTIALRAAGQPVSRERLAFAPKHGVDRLDQTLDRNLVGIVIAADEAVFCKSGPSGGGRRQPGWQQRREIERCGSHRRRLPFIRWVRP
jgi:hypothetical protein